MPRRLTTIVTRMCPMARQRKKNYTIRAVSNAIDLLEQFHGDVAEMGLTDLSRTLRLPKNNIFRLLATLQSRNYVEQNTDTEKYRLGFKTVELGQRVVRQLGRLNNSRAVMEALVRECNETVCVSILKDFCVVNLDTVECDHPLRVIPRIGVRLPAYCTAAGKSQLAHFADEALRKYISDCQLQQYTPFTITSRKELRAHLEQVARQGYAIGHEELDLGVRSVAAPIRDYTSRIVGAVTLLGPSQRFGDERIEGTFVPLVLKGAAEISGKLGYSDVVSSLPPQFCQGGAA
jgi:DNA-binding IclR family transcriptional regulator